MTVVCLVRLGEGGPVLGPTGWNEAAWLLRESFLALAVGLARRRRGPCDGSMYSSSGPAKGSEDGLVADPGFALDFPFLVPSS
jgi:hypothetical protein